MFVLRPSPWSSPLVWIGPACRALVRRVDTCPLSPSISCCSSLRRAIRRLVRMSKVSKNKARDEVLVLRFGIFRRCGSCRWCHIYAVISALKEHWLNWVMNTVVEINLFRKDRNARAGVRSGEIRPSHDGITWLPHLAAESSGEVTQRHHIINDE